MRYTNIFFPSQKNVITNDYTIAKICKNLVNVSAPEECYLGYSQIIFSI